MGKIKKTEKTSYALAQVEDNLTSTSTTNAGSANQLRVLNEKIENLENKTEESDWVELTIMHNKLIKRASNERNYAPRCKKIGNVVYVTGQLRATDTITGSCTILNIPERIQAFS